MVTLRRSHAGDDVAVALDMLSQSALGRVLITKPNKALKLVQREREGERERERERTK